MLSVCDPAAHHGLSFPTGGRGGKEGGQGKWAAAKMDGARGPPPTCPEVSGSVEVTPTCPPPSRRRDGSDRRTEGDEGKKKFKRATEWMEGLLSCSE